MPDEESDTSFKRGSHRLLFAATGCIILMHFVLLVPANAKRQAAVDVSFNLALARQYALHGVYFRDNVHFAPQHRPNLQGPALHFLMGQMANGVTFSTQISLGDALIQVNLFFCLLGWICASATVGFFARRLSGDIAMLVAVALFTGGSYGSGLFAANICSGWMFVCVPWSIHFFVEKRLIPCVSVTALGCYFHLGGFFTAPFGIFTVACLQRRWRDLWIVGVSVALLTLPYLVHFFSSLMYFNGQKGGTAWWIDPLGLAGFLLGAAFTARHPRQNAFLLGWMATGTPWLIQDASRFVLQASFPGSVAGAVILVNWLLHSRPTWPIGRIAASIAWASTFIPIGIPAIYSEILAARIGFPDALEWSEYRQNALAIQEFLQQRRRQHLSEPIICGYASHVSSGIAVWADVRVFRGHWIEVQPPVDPGLTTSVASKLYVTGLAPNDPLVEECRDLGWVSVVGAGDFLTTLEFVNQPDESAATGLRDRVWAETAEWISEHGESNQLGNVFKLFFDSSEVPRRREQLRAYRQRIAQCQLALLCLAYSLEATDPPVAQKYQEWATIGFGWWESLVGDEARFGYRTVADHDLLKEEMRIVATLRKSPNFETQFIAAADRFIRAERGSLFANEN